MDDASTFRDKFSTIAARIDATGEHKAEITRSMAGDDTIVIIKRTSNNRGFGLLWTGDELRGMRSRTFDSSQSDSSPGNADFLEELDRRLAVIGASAIALPGGGDYLRFVDDVSARGNVKKFHRRIAPNKRLAKELAASAF